MTMRMLHKEDTRTALRQILPSVFSDRRIEAIHAIATILDSSPAEELPWIEELVRTTWRAAWHEPPFVQDLLTGHGTLAAGIMGVLSFHPSGYVREAAVKRLAMRDDGSEVPYLLLRLNDWVPEVREAARLAVLDRLRNGLTAVFTRNFSLVDRAIRMQRAGDSSVAGVLATVLATDAGHAAVLSAMESGTRPAARAVVRFVIDRVPGGIPVVVRAGVEAKDPLIRMWTTAHLSRAIPQQEALPMLQRLTTDASPAVRRQSLAALAQSFPDEAQTCFQRSVLDVSASVRDLARFSLRERAMDFRAIYEKAVSTAATTRQLATAITGLAEVGSAADAETAAPYLEHASATVRRAALRCVMRLSGDAFTGRALGLLQDPARPVSAAARDSLRSHVATVGRSSLEEVITRAPDRHARINALHLVPALAKWQSIPGLLRAVAGEDEEVASVAQKYVRDWTRNYNRSQTVPSPREIAELDSALLAAEGVLDRSIVDEIRFVSRIFATG